MKRAALPLLVMPLIVMGILYSFDVAPVLGSVALIFWVLVSIPVGILTALDWYRYTSPESTGQKVLRQALRIPIFLLGITAVAIGTSVLVWVAYNLLWERQPQFHAGGSALTMLGILAFGCYLVRIAARVPTGHPDEGSPTDFENQDEVDDDY
jgi:ABC-type dipeptide/oligopeptide/nickel transport system permease component